MNRGPLVLVDDDTDDLELMLKVIEQLGFQHEVKVFDTADAALEFLYHADERPFLIVCDVNMPKMDGIAFKRTIDQSDLLRSKRIPFVFLSTSDSFAKDLYSLDVQGYFEKGSTLQDLQDTIAAILSYWDKTRHLN